MKLLFYYSRESIQTQRLESLIQEFVPHDAIERIRSIGALSQRLKEPTSDITTAVFVANGFDELMEFDDFRNYFFELRHIIILPEKDEKMIAAAYKLRPRFLSFFEYDFNVVYAVLKKLFAGSKIMKSQDIDVRNRELSWSFLQA